MGLIEVTRLGMTPADMDTVAGFMARVLVEREEPEAVGPDAEAFRVPFQTIYYCFDNPAPPGY